MALLKFLRRESPAANPAAAAPAAKATAKARAKADEAGLSPAGDAVQQARDRARRRLIGAALLLGVGVIAFPLVFQTQPRPLPVDIPIDIPRRDAAPPLTLGSGTAEAPAGKGAPAVSGVPGGVVIEGEPVRTEPARESAQAPAPIEVERIPANPSTAVKEPAPQAPVAQVASPPATAPTGSASPPPAVPPKAEVAGADTGRFIVQAGAYTDAASVRDARSKIERLGLKTYTQVVEVDGVSRTRVRVGPFTSRQEAQQAQARIKAAGLAANLLQL